MNIPQRLSRSMLFVPAARPDMIAKAARSAADAVCIDLEDAVAPSDKAASRANVVRALTELDWGGRTRIFRINGLDTPWAYRDIIEVVEAAGQQIDLVMLPKASRAADVQFVATLLAQIEAARGFTRPIGIEAQIETAQGCLNVAEIAAAAPRLEALIFGPGDYAASLRMPLASIGAFDEHDALYPGHRWHYIMQAIVVAARANGLRCMDGPFAGLHDAAKLERACRIARALGFDGKQCIHPAQLGTVNAAFAPSAAELAWAEKIIAAYQHAQAQGRGAIGVDGTMIDAANLRMAQTIVQQQEQLSAKDAKD